MLSMMILLVVVAVGLLGLSTIELRKSSVGSAMQQARANARMAMMIALGELQENLGPDQRVAASGRVGSSGTVTPAHPHWLSVWRSTRDDGTPWITRDGEKGGLSDQRQATGWNARDERIATLVSGNEAGINDQDNQADMEAGMISLVDKGSLGIAADSSQVVRVPRVRIGDRTKAHGAYAWWVGDLGTQANIATQDSTESSSKLHALMLAQDASWKAFGAAELDNDRRAKLLSEAQLALVEPGFDDRHFHDFTVWSAGLPVDVREGGWRRDLTAFIESGGSVPELKQGDVYLPGLKDSDNLVGGSGRDGQQNRFSEVSPNFGLLRTWAQRAAKVSQGNHSAKTELGQTVNVPRGNRVDKDVDFRNRTVTHLMPVLAEGSIYYNLSYYPLAVPVQGNPYGMRVHYYPRVTLWNPYNFDLEVPQSAINLHINGAKWVEVTMEGGIKQNYRMFWGTGNNTATGGAARGSMFFKLEAATIKPGESLVWSPAGNAAYDEANMANNVLSPRVGPSPTRSFYQDRRLDNQGLFQLPPVEFGTRPPPGLVQNLLRQLPLEWREIVPAKPSGNLQAAAYTQADDYRVLWKPFTGGILNPTAFRNLPMGRFVSCAYQYGDEDELPIEWTALDPVPYLKSTLASPVVTAMPDRRTRDGFRLRWFQETESNIIGSGSLAGLPHLEDSPIGNWNMRSSWAFRNPFDNVTDVAPHFFGIYTRDLFDGEVDWSGMNPRASGGTFRSDPFDQPVRSQAPRILFDIPRTGTEIASLGALQHVNFSEFVWHPTYALGNSLADPRIPPLHTEPDRRDRINRDKGGWNQDSIGYSTIDGRSDRNGASNRTDEDNWAYHARDFLAQAALSQTLVYDLSYELNHTLWDSYFLSSGTPQQKQELFSNNMARPLPNGRMRPNPLAGGITASDLTDYHRAAPALLVDGAFNINSTSVSAWEALLLSGIGKQYGDDAVAFPRILNASGGEWDGKDPRADGAWSGQRVFNRDEIRKLAGEIVAEVETRGPFLSLADFVNRRLSGDESGKKGALQAAIDRAGLNGSFTEEWPLNNLQSLPDYDHNDNINDPTRLEQTLKPDTSAWGALGFLTQADLLQFIGPALSARSDTFRIRAYGESRDASGKLTARAWCEAVVQRAPGYVDSADDLLQTPDKLNATNRKFGRRFEIVTLRWLNPEEI